MMRSRLLVVVVAAGLLVACDDDNPTSPTGTSIVTMSALLSPANEVPAIANAENVARGAAQITFDISRDASGTITSATATMYFQLLNLPNGTIIRGAHIHSAPAGVNGNIVVDTGVSPTNTVTLEGGRQEFTFGPIGVGPVLMGNILANPAAFYFNVHTVTNPGGLARGQLSVVG
jgi:CHRD domain-containing protein